MTDAETGSLEILEKLKENPRGMSVSELAEALSINRNTAARYLDKLLLSGRVEMRTFGKAKVFFAAKRVPVSAMLNLSSEMVLLINSDLCIIQANKPVLDLLSCSAEEILGRCIYEGAGRALCSGELTEHLRSALRGHTVRDELILERNDTTFILEERIFPIVLPDGTPGATLLLDDITSRVRAEERLAESSAELRRIVETVRDVLWSADEQGIIRYISRGIVRVAGYRPEELIGKPLTSLFREKDAQRVSAAFFAEQTRVSGFSLHELQIPAADRTLRYADVTASPIASGKDGTFFGCSGALHDVTGRHEAELGERQWRLFLNAVIENIPAIVTASDLATGRYYYANREAEQFLRYSRNELMHMTIHRILEEIGGDQLKTALASAAAKREKITVKDTVVVGKKEKRISASFVPMRLSAEREYIIAIVYPDDSLQVTEQRPQEPQR
ncbi:MAG: PAS domain S-box protein [Methanocorpusculum sp.]|nr:PAS domain S-box protein [Methanocorpusculum sp.]